jgi:DHA1 family bicyclomycin/chloramphenicol resistance-like MFS transporter
MTRGERRHNPVIVVLGALAAIGSFSVDMYLPGFPAIVRDLKTDSTHVGFTMTSYFIGIGLGQLLYGPVLDRYGRKKPLVFGLFVSIGAALGCALAPSIDFLIGLRLLLALGACVGMVGSRAVVRDLFSRDEIARALSMLMMVFGIAPIIAPTMGGLVLAAMGWRFIFCFLAAIAALILVAVRLFLPESKGADPSISLRPLQVLSEYLKVLRARLFVVPAVGVAAASGGLFAYLTEAPFVFINLFGFTPTQSGWIFGTNAVAMILGSQVNRLWLRRQESVTVLLTIAITQSAAAALLLSGSLMGFLSPFATLGLIFSYAFCFGLVLPNAMGLAMEHFSKNAGSASALIGSLQMAAGAVTSALVSTLHNGTAVPMASVMTACAGVSLVMAAMSALSARTARRSSREFFSPGT